MTPPHEPDDPSSDAGMREVLRTAQGEIWVRVRAESSEGANVRLFVGTESDEVDVVLPAAVAARLGTALTRTAEAVSGGGTHTDAGADTEPALRSVARSDPRLAERKVPPTPGGPPHEVRPWDEIPDHDDADAAFTAAVARLRRLSEVLPETAEIDALGAPTFRVATRMFATVERHGGMPVVRFKATWDDQAVLLGDERFRSDPDTGQHGWTNLRADDLGEPDHFEQLMIASYRLVAPADVISQLDALLDAADGNTSSGA